MFWKSKSDAVTLLLTERNLDLERSLVELRRKIEELEKENKTLWDALERPAVGTMNDSQIHLLSELLFQRIVGFPIPKKEIPS